MFGLEKKQKMPFEFDLEKEMKADPSKARKLLEKIDNYIHDLKNALREGAASEDFDQLGVLLHGFAALQRVLNRIATKK